LRDVVRVLAFQSIQQCRISVQVVEIFQQRVTIGLGEIRIRLELRNRRSHLDRRLLVPDRRLDRGVVRADEPIDRGRLMLFDAHELRHAQRHLLGTQGVQLQPVHEDDAHACERIVIELADGLAHHVLPAHPLFAKRRALVFQQIDSHRRISSNSR
jgi:hypothetical protein